MDLIEKLNNCSLEEVNDIIAKELEVKNEESKGIEVLGFDCLRLSIPPYRGFIPKDSRIKYSNFGVDYSMKTQDYFYEFADYIKKKNTISKNIIVNSIEPFINQYFGFNKYNFDARDIVFNDEALQTSTTEEEYFDKLDNNEIRDLKGLGVAMCTEKAAIAQNILSLFGFDSYYCMGCFDYNGKQESHCFNIVRAKEKFALVDYSMPVPMISNGKVVNFSPFQGYIELGEIEDVLNSNTSKSFESYQGEKRKGDSSFTKVFTSEERKYIVGDLEFKQEKPHHL